MNSNEMPSIIVKLVVTATALIILIHLGAVKAASSDSDTIVLVPSQVEIVIKDDYSVENKKHNEQSSSAGNRPPENLSPSLYNDGMQSNGGMQMVEGDILLEPGTTLQGDKLPSSTRGKRKIAGDVWPKNIIPWRVDTSLPAYTAYGMGKITEAMSWWEQHTCVKFIPSSSRPNVGHSKVLVISNEISCASYVGFRASLPGNDQVIRLSEVLCLSSAGTPAHELGHVLGLIHEHTRTDRDDYVHLDPNTLDSESMHNFDVAYDSTIPDGVPYDVSSIMHYRSEAFSRDGSTPVITSKDLKKQELMGQREALSFYDIKAINVQYQCKGNCNNRCLNEGYPHRTSDGRCICVCPEGLSGSSCEKIDTNCGDVLTVPAGGSIKLSSPGYPNSPSSWYQKCHWLLQTNSGYNLEVKFDDMDVSMSSPSIYSGSKCIHSVEIRNNMLGQRGDIYCGDGPLAPITTEKGYNKNQMMISLDMTDRSSRGKGFSATISSYIDGCTSSPCLNGGSCVSSRSYSFTCKCLEGFTGRICDMATDGAVSCDFSEGMCSFTNANNDQIDFQRTFRSYKYKELMERNSGGNKFFLAAPVEYTTNAGSEAKLISPIFSASAQSDRCLSFYYKIDGQWQQGSISVSLIDPYTNRALKSVATISRTAGSGWRLYQANINHNSNYKIEFSFKTSPFLPYNSAVGLDDISIKPQKCYNSPCSSSRCSSESTCAETGSSTYKCICPPGRTGTYCHSYDTDGFVCSFDSPNMCGWEQDKRDSYDWIRTHGASDTLKRTGPLAGAGGDGYYMLSDASTSTGDTGTVSRIISPSVWYTGQLCVSFNYLMYGDNLGYLKLRTQTNGQLQSQNHFQKTGSQSTKWLYAQVDITTTTADTRLVFEASVGRRHLSDIAVDEVKVIKGRCSGSSSQAPTTRRQPATTRRLPTTRRQPTTRRPATTRRQPTTRRPVPTTIKYTVNPSVVGKFDTRLRVNTAGTLLSCDFESDTCPTQFTIYDPKNLLRRLSTRTGTHNTGPSSAAQGRFYAHMESSYPAQQNDYIMLYTSYLRHTGSICVSFKYHMFGEGMGVLKVSKSSSSRQDVIWQQSGNKGNRWLDADITVNVQYTDKLIISMLRGTSVESDVSLDDIIVKSGACNSQRTTYTSYTCDFEDGGTCDFIQNKVDDADWKVQTGPTSSSGTGPDSAQSGKSYIYLESSYPLEPGSSAILSSPTILARGGDVCLDFHYHMKGEGLGSLSVYVLYSDQTTRTILSRWKDEGDDWHRMWNTIPDSDMDYQVIFKASSGTGNSYWTSDIALDNISIHTGKCTS